LGKALCLALQTLRWAVAQPDAVFLAAETTAERQAGSVKAIIRLGYEFCGSLCRRFAHNATMKG